VLATDAYPTPQKLHKALKRALGYVEMIPDLNGGEFEDVDSIAISAMDQQEFQVYFNRAMELLAKLTGIDPMTLLSEAA
jgi:hypothetical protein